MVNPYRTGTDCELHMIRLTKLTDYSIVLMSHLAGEPKELMTASSLAHETHLALPTVSKILKVLSHEGLLVSYRGAHGGYMLARSPNEISVADLIAAMEGPIAMTECADLHAECVQESFCRVRDNWQKINDAVRYALASISLEEMAQPLALPFEAPATTLVHLGSVGQQHGSVG